MTIIIIVSPDSPDKHRITLIHLGLVQRVGSHGEDARQWTKVTTRTLSLCSGNEALKWRVGCSLDGRTVMEAVSAVL